MRMRFSALSLLFFAALFARKADLLAQDLDSSKAEPSASSSSSSAGLPEPPPEEVGPLDAWSNQILPEEFSSSTSGKEPVSGQEPKTESTPAAEEGEESAQSPEEVPPPAESAPKGVLTKVQQQRMLKLKARLRRRAIKEYSARIAATAVDQRGEPELTFCSVNANGYGIRAEVLRLLGRRELPHLSRKENSLVAAISKAKCNVAAVQGVIGREGQHLERAFKRLSTKLNKKTGQSWSYRYSFVAGQHTASGVLVSSGIEFQGAKVFAEMPLIHFGLFSEKEFARPPFELEMIVSGRAGASARKVHLLVFDFAKGTRGEAPSEALRMQFADAVRRIVIKDQQEIDPDNPHLLVIAGDRVGPRWQPSARVLSGRLRLEDFRSGGRCKLKEDGKAECAEDVHYPEELIGLTTESLLKPMHTTMKKGKDGNETRNTSKADVSARKTEETWRKVQTCEVYVTPYDIAPALGSPAAPLVYKYGRLGVANGLRGRSPLLWVEFNW